MASSPTTSWEIETHLQAHVRFPCCRAGGHVCNLIPKHIHTPKIPGFPHGSVVKESTCSAGDAGDPGSILGLGKSLGGEHGNPFQYPCLENPVDRGAWWATVHGVAKSRTGLKRLSMDTCVYVICKCYISQNGEGNGSPLQYPCLENPVDRGAWWATVCGVAKSQTRPSD